MGRYCYVNGEIVPFERAVISISDLGLLRSYAVFDLLRTYNRAPFRMDDHLARFRNSAEEYGLELSQTDEEIKSVILELISMSDVREAAIRLVLTGGYAMDGVNSGSPNFFIIIEETPAYDDRIYREGVKLITFRFRRSVPYAKSTNYANALKLSKKISEAGAFEVLYVWEDEVLEVSRNNIFLVRDNVLITPLENVLHGVTRKVILEIASCVMKVEERKVDLQELERSDEIFLTGTLKKVVPVIRIGDHVVGAGRVGEVTRKLMKEFEDLTSKNGL